MSEDYFRPFPKRTTRSIPNPESNDMPFEQPTTPPPIDGRDIPNIISSTKIWIAESELKKLLRAYFKQKFNLDKNVSIRFKMREGVNTGDPREYCTTQFEGVEIEYDSTK